MQALLDDVMDTTEVHWSTGTILAVFFAASLISAVFFGLGYSFGRGGATKPALGMASSGSGTAPGSAQPLSNHALYSDATAPAAHANGTLASYRSSDRAKPAYAASRQVSATQTPRAAIVSAKAVKHATVHAAHAGAARYMVQVGAIGDRRDARLLVSRLRKKGFHAGIYPGKHDKYLHVQIGPFASAQQAQTVRHRVTASGYHAILKHAS